MNDKMLKAMALAAILLTSTAGAQSLSQIGGPANPPPAGFQGQQFVDSRGCLFLRAGYGARVNWVARVDRNRKPICTMMPTGSAAAQAALAADMAPDKLAVAQPTVQAPASGQVAMVAVQAPAGQVAPPSPAPKPTVFSNTQTVAPARVAAVAVQAPAMQVLAPSPAPQPKVFASAAAAKAQQPAPTRQIVPTDQTLGYVAAPVYVTPSAPAATGPLAMVQVYVAPPPLPDRSHALPKPPKGWTYAWKDDRLNPLRGVGTALGQAQQDQVWQGTVPMVLVTEAPPQTAFQRALGLHPQFRTTRAAASVSTVASTMSTAAVPERSRSLAPLMQVSVSPAAPMVPGSRLVQVGCFGEPANAQAVVARLAARGLPVSTVQTRRNGKALQVVYVGPFASGDAASSGLTTVQSAGFTDAFLR